MLYFPLGLWALWERRSPADTYPVAGRTGAPCLSFRSARTAWTVPRASGAPARRGDTRCARAGSRAEEVLYDNNPPPGDGLADRKVNVGWLAGSVAGSHPFLQCRRCICKSCDFRAGIMQNLVRRPEWPAGGDGSASADARGRRPAGRRSRPRTARRAVGARCRGCSEGSFRGLDVPGWLAGSTPGGWLRSWPALGIRASWRESNFVADMLQGSIAMCS